MQEKAQFVIWLAEGKFIVWVQRSMYKRDLLVDQTIRRWFNQHKESVMLLCLRSRKKAVALRSFQLGIHKTTIQNVLHKRLRLHAYKILHEIKHTVRYSRLQVVDLIVESMAVTPPSRRAIYRDETTYYMNGHLNGHKWGPTTAA